MSYVIEETRQDVQQARLTDQELDYFKRLILDKRAEAAEELEQLQNSLANMIETDQAESSSNAHHMADVATDQEAIQLYYRLIGRTSSYIRQLDKALIRIEKKTYGICRATGNRISKKRLEAVPHTRYDIDAKLKGLDKTRIN